MSGLEVASTAGVKRKRDSAKAARHISKDKVRRKTSSSDDEADPQSHILRLETQILESRRHFNNIATLLQKARSKDPKDEAAVLSAVSLCRVFARLLSAGDMKKKKGAMPESELVIARWLKERYREYIELLLKHYLKSAEASRQSVALTLLMRIIKEESNAERDYNWRHGPLPNLVETLLFLPESHAIRNEFGENYLKQHDDLRFATFATIKDVLDSSFHGSEELIVSANSLSMLLDLGQAPGAKDDVDFYFTNAAKETKSIPAQKARAQEAWLATLRCPMSKEQQKAVLHGFSHQIAPWFQQPEMLMDFLTDAFDMGGATSLLALSGMYYLMTERNLDYPSFYQKLYSLLDEGILHSKHRSRFLRLLDTFMSSTHLPAVLVASFIKRLSRLALHAPPAGIVVVVPWIYNMFKRHPACTFMMHREIRDPEIKRNLEQEGMEDPFDMDEKDPMLTDAVESSVWEIESLQTHYHPNVATLAKIISEQFTKRSYNLEDFLDHSYTALLDAELGRESKKEPVVEFEIPKRIFTAEEGGLNNLGQLFTQVIGPSAT
ncbi:CBF-domain-containing protein [Polyplosphaeria fusca]|uniref:CBF-domain-containing protein n=1 Tax=Polyplosphaeria fusca TaxID=682080 RepID=A0A9P4V891_9PLEO|nr:CBF-domain-containing protein [Polyplosphaeria fusca]